MDKKDNTIYVIFRNDDPCALSDWKKERKVLEVFERYNVPQVLAVTPRVTEDPHNDKLDFFYPLEENKEMVLLLKEYYSKGLIEVAQHGFTHQTNSNYPSSTEEITGDNYYLGIGGRWLPFDPERGEYSEFKGLSYEAKKEKIVKGKKYLENIFQIEIKSFIFPWNTFDDDCLKILSQLNFKCVPAGYAESLNRSEGLCVLYNGYEGFWNAPFIPEEILKTDESALVHFLYHSWNLSDEKIVKLEKILGELSLNKRIKFIKIKELDEIFPRINRVARLNNYLYRLGAIADPYLKHKVTPTFYSFNIMKYLKKILRACLSIVIYKWCGLRNALFLSMSLVILCAFLYYYSRYNPMYLVGSVSMLFISMKLLAWVINDRACLENNYTKVD